MPSGELFLNGRADRRQVTQRVLIIHFAEYIVRQADPGYSPAPMQWSARCRTDLGRMIEVLVVGLEEPPVRNPELIDSAAGITVGAEQNPVLIFQEKLANHDGRAAQIL